MKKRILSILLCFVLLAPTLTSQVAVADAQISSERGGGVIASESGETQESQQTKSTGGITVSGMLPEGVTLDVTKGTEPGAAKNGKNGVKKGGSADFKAVYDISLIIKDEAVQPTGAVNVTFGGAKVMKGDNVTIIHYLDDEEAIARSTETYNGCPVEIFSTEKGNLTINADGTVSIAVSSFSTFAYTVEFHNGDLEYVIAGGSSVLLSTIFTALNYPYTVADVENVSFSDPELIAVETMEDGDWLLTSLKAFETHETLTIVFKDGRAVDGVLEMLVTDAVNTPLTFPGGKGTDGAWSNTDGVARVYAPKIRITYPDGSTSDAQYNGNVKKLDCGYFMTLFVTEAYGY